MVATFTASDLDDQDNVTYEITSGNDNNYFAIDSDGKVTLTDAGVAAINSDAGVDLTSLTLGVTASDGTNTSSESQVTVNITRVNDNAPTIDTAAGSTVTEESVSTSTVVATFTASDVTRFNIKTAGKGQCNNVSANNRLVRGLKYKATIYVADSSGTFFLSTLKDSAIDQQHALKNGWNEIEFTMGDSLYPVRKGNAQAGQYIDIGFFSVTALTEEVVINRVDMAGLEFSKQKAREYLYPYGMIQSKATTVDGVATTEDTIRPITDMNLRYRFLLNVLTGPSTQLGLAEFQFRISVPCT